jgi:hypothetical protein
LLGTHRTVACADCHKSTSSYESRFAGTSPLCESCHKDAHDNQFAAKEGSTHCAECHNSLRWSPSTFDHETRTHFTLTGGHSNLACAKCHIQTKQLGDKQIVIYKNTPSKCANCHGDNPVTQNLKPL